MFHTYRHFESALAHETYLTFHDWLQNPKLEKTLNMREKFTMILTSHIQQFIRQIFFIGIPSHNIIYLHQNKSDF